MIEIWRDIIGYEGMYQISNTGNVKSLVRKNNKVEKILKPAINTEGYKHVILFKNKVSHNTRIHRLVARHFIENPLNKKCVNHIDGVKTNNNVTNLEWVTNSENIRHAFKMGLLKKKIPHLKVLQFDKQDNFIKEWNSVTEIETTLSIVSTSIYSCCWGKRKSAGGFKWKYK